MCHTCMRTEGVKYENTLIENPFSMEYNPHNQEFTKTFQLEDNPSETSAAKF